MNKDIVTLKDGEERELLRLLEKVFNNFPPRFLKSLPNLYKPEYHPCPNNLVVRGEGGKGLLAAVGLYPMEYCVGDIKLIVAGIGNVAVDKKCRGAGYMKLLMNQSAELSKERGTDFLVLSGQRQRYQYFGYERAGSARGFEISQNNLRHTLRGQTPAVLAAELLRTEDTESLKGIHALNEAAPMHRVRPENPSALWDILCAWRSVPHVLRSGGAFAGYYISDKEGKYVSELRLKDPAHISGAVQTIINDAKGGVNFSVLPAETETCAILAELGESASIGGGNAYYVMNYRRVLDAFLRLRAKMAPLCEGEIVIRVNGFSGTENLRIKAKGDEISVEATDGEHEITLEHLAATRCFFAQVSYERAKLPAFAASWFPLPLEFPHADSV
ncbi:MAG: GNAT family N-acetyltransferase [Oscillospiraceae bacterium]|nr:GNAT family N-acetyltransferase [Oscillospiraceae bacterium]